MMTACSTVYFAFQTSLAYVDDFQIKQSNDDRSTIYGHWD